MHPPIPPRPPALRQKNLHLFKRHPQHPRHRGQRPPFHPRLNLHHSPLSYLLHFAPMLGPTRRPSTVGHLEPFLSDVFKPCFLQPGVLAVEDIKRFAHFLARQRKQFSPSA
jgi:hypothetical protein